MFPNRGGGLKSLFTFLAISFCTADKMVDSNPKSIQVDARLASGESRKPKVHNQSAKTENADCDKISHELLLRLLIARV